MTSPGQAAGRPLACLAVSCSPSSELGDCEEKEEGALGWKMASRALQQGQGRSGRCSSRTLSGCLQSCYLNSLSLGSCEAVWAPLSFSVSFRLPSPPSHF